MKDEKSIRIKSFHLRNLRNSLRQIIFEAFATKQGKLIEAKDEFSYSKTRLWDETAKSEGYKKADAIRKEIKDFREQIYASICVCRACYRIFNDMIHFKELNEWFCVDCAGEKSYYIEIYRHRKHSGPHAIFSENKKSTAKDRELDRELDLKYNLKQHMRVPEELPASISLQLIKQEKAQIISKYDYEIWKLFMKYGKGKVNHSETFAKVKEDMLKIDKANELLKESAYFYKRRERISHTSRPKTKEQISQIIENLKKHNHYE